MKDKSKVEIKPAFEKRYRDLLGDRYDEFMKTSLTFLRRSIRVNTIKTSVREMKESLSDDWKLTQVPWCPEGFWIEHNTGRRDIGNLPEHSLGYIYVQEAASMIPPLALSIKDSKNENNMVLDMAASPGSKTTQIGMYMKNKGLLIANDYKPDRMKPLSINVQRCGLTNCIITLMQGQWFKTQRASALVHRTKGSVESGIEFDYVLTDVPCSGTGTIRKSFKTLRIWNPGVVKRLAITQKQMIKAGFEILKEGGTLVYSTCSQEPEENEAVIDYLLSEFDNATVEKIKLNITRSDAILEFDGRKYNDQIKHALRIYPQDNDTEGFFVCKIKKE